jgi:hypothetical protein
MSLTLTPIACSPRECRARGRRPAAQPREHDRRSRHSPAVVNWVCITALPGSVDTSRGHQLDHVHTALRPLRDAADDLAGR